MELFEKFLLDHRSVENRDNSVAAHIRYGNKNVARLGILSNVHLNIRCVLDIELTDDEYDTIAGLVISQLDRVPEETEHPVVNYKNLRIKVLKVEENAIAKVLIHINPVEDPEEGSKEENPKSDE